MDRRPGPGRAPARSRPVEAADVCRASPLAHGGRGGPRRLHERALPRSSAPGRVAYAPSRFPFRLVADCAETVLRLETWVSFDGSPTLPEIAALTSPMKSTPWALRRIRRWMTLRICIGVFSPSQAAVKPLSTPRLPTALPPVSAGSPTLQGSYGGVAREPSAPSRVTRPSRAGARRDREHVASRVPADPRARPSRRCGGARP
jgi:hypothetical protein